MVAERDFPGNIEAIELNSEYAAVLCEGRIHLQLIEANSRQYGDQHAEIFSENEGRITHMKMTETLLIYSTDTGGRGGANGSVKFFLYQNGSHWKDASIDMTTPLCTFSQTVLARGYA